MISLPWRDDSTGPMQVISDSIGREKVHFEAPPAKRLDAETTRFLRERKTYYDILERTQKGSMDITVWSQWFLGELLKAIEQAHITLDQVLTKARFWGWPQPFQ